MVLAPPRTCAEVTWSEWRLDVLRDSRPVSGKYCSSITPVLGARGRVKNLLKMSSTCLDPPPRGSDVQMGRSCVTGCPLVIVCEVYPGFSLFFSSLLVLLLFLFFFFSFSLSYFYFLTLKLSVAFSPLWLSPLSISPTPPVRFLSLFPIFFQPRFFSVFFSVSPATSSPTTHLSPPSLLRSCTCKLELGRRGGGGGYPRWQRAE